MDTDNADADADAATPRMFQRPEELAHLMPHYEESTAVEQAVRNAMALMEQFASSAESYEQQQQQPPPPVTTTTTSSISTTTGSSTQHNNNKGDPDNPWNNPDQIYQQLDQARHEISQAWEKLHAVNQRDQQCAGAVDGPLRTSSSSSGAEDETAPKLEQEQQQQNILRMAYMDMITDAFADVLEDLRQRQESSSETNKDNDTMDVETLVDCLQNGLDLLISSSSSNIDNGLSWSSFNENDFAFGGDTTQSEDNAATDGDDDNKSNDDVKLTPHESRRRQLGYLLVDQLSETKVI